MNLKRKKQAFSLIYVGQEMLKIIRAAREVSPY